MSSVSPAILRRCACGKSAAGGECDACRKKRTSLQRSGSGTAGVHTAPTEVHEELRRPGRPLPEHARRKAEELLQYDLSGVRIHVGESAAKSAEAINARAFTVANHVVFGRDNYQPGSLEGDRLLMHELTHVRQQQSDSVPDALRIAPSDDTFEREAQRVGGRPSDLDSRPSSSGLIQRDENADEQARASAAAAGLRCDVPSMCAMHWASPSAVPMTLIRSTFRSCYPNQAIPSNPCLSVLPPAAIPAPSPSGPQPFGPQPAPAPSAGVGPLAALSGALDFTLNLGDLRLNVELPSSIKATLPVRFRGGGRLTFELSGTTSGDFRFSAKVDQIPHITITIRAGVNLESGVASGGIVFATRSETCQVRDPAATRSAIERSGREIQTAVRALQSRSESGTDTARDHLISIASAISDINEAIDRARGPCRPQPSFELEFGARTPIRPHEGAGPPSPSMSPYMGITGTLRF